MNQLQFCTLFNAAYLTRGLVLYESLEKHCASFHLYIFAFDDTSARALRELQLPHATVIDLQQFEDPELLRIKPTRSAGEYCWTCTPSTILYCIEKFQLDHCTYIDADMCFYSDPRVLIDEMGTNSVLLTEHRYSPAYDQSKVSGTYCVQFMCFKNTTQGMTALRWWRAACIEWCYARVEDGKFGDQMYLEDWTTRFEGVHVLQHLGGGMAPWNVQQYEVHSVSKATESATGRSFALVFFHFHGLKFHVRSYVELTGAIYALPQNTVQLLYFPYVKALLAAEQRVAKQCGQTFDAAGHSKQLPDVRWKRGLKYLVSNAFLRKKDSPKLHNHLYPLSAF